MTLYEIRETIRVQKELDESGISDTISKNVKDIYEKEGYNVSVSGIGWRIKK